MPSLYELSALFDELPYLPPPTPRRRGPYTTAKFKSAPAPPTKPTPSHTQLSRPQPHALSNPTLLQRLFALLHRILVLLRIRTQTVEKSQATAQPRRVNPFAVLKAGKKMIVVAAVDAGTISFFRFGQGAFEDFPMN